MLPPRLILGSVALLTGIVLFSVPFSSEAALTASEPFDFTGTALVGNGSGTGWGANLWMGGTVAMPNDGTSLVYPAGSAFPVSGQRIKPTASATATRLLASSFNLASGNGPYYLSFLAKKDATGAFRIEANNATPAPRWGVKVNADGSVAVQGGGTAYGTASGAGAFANATTYLVVLKYVGSGSAPSAVMKLFKEGDIIPTGDSGITWDATHSASTGVTQDRFQIVISAGTVEIDEFRFGTTWGDVVGTGGVATTTIKANNIDNLNLASSWTGSVPNPSLVAIWDSTVTGANTTSLGADATWSGINILNPGGLVTINAGNTLTLGAAATDIDLGSATADLTLNCALTLGAANVWNVATNRTLTVGGVVAGAFPVTKSGTGTAVLTGANTYSGTTTLSAGVLSVSATNNLGAPTAGLLFDGGTLRVTGTTMTNVGHALSFTADKNVTLEIGDAGNTFIVDQALTQGTGRFIKQGPGTATLTGADTYTGNLIVRQGTLNLWGAKTGAVGGMAVADTAGLNATLNLANGLYAVVAGAEFSVGNATTTAATGTVNQSGGQVTFGASGNQLLIGRQANVGNIGNYNLSGGSITIPLSSQANRGVMLGVNHGASGNFTLSGTGVLNLTTASGGSGDAHLLLGRADSAADNTTNTFSQSGGTANIGRLSLGGSGTTSVGVRSTLTLTGGTFSANQFTRLAAGDGNVATINIGGTAQVTLPAFPTDRGSGATATLNFDGGSLSPLAASASYLSNLTAAYIKAGGATINVGSGNDITIAQALLTDPVSTGGGLTKTGPGSLTLASNNTYSGNTTISNGTLALSGSGSVSNTASINIGSGAAFDLSGLNSVCSLNGNLITGSGTLVLAYGVSPAISCGGTVTLSGSTTLVITNTGAELGHGSYKLIAKAGSGAVTGTLPTNYSVTGGGAATPNYLWLSNGELYLAVNHAPVARNVTNSVALGESFSLPFDLGKYKLATDADGDALTITSVSASLGSVSTDGFSIIYTNTSAGATDSISYTVSDGLGGTDTKIIAVFIGSGTGANLVSAKEGGGNAYLSYAGIPANNYALDKATSITPPITWVPQVTNTADGLGRLNYTNTLSSWPTNDFFRTRHVP